MPPSPDPSDPQKAKTPRNGPARPEDATSTDLVGPVPEYLQEIHAALRRAEEAYAHGDLDASVRAAEEGLAAIRLIQPKLGPQGLPPHLHAFLHAFRIQPEYRKAVGLLKQGLTAAGRATDDKVVARGLQSFRTAWKLLEPLTAGLGEGLPVEVLVCEYPVAGRVLRGVVRLRAKLEACLEGGPEDTVDI